jgi:signal transduction histidine kinase
MSDTKNRVASAIARAQAELDGALADLERVPAFEQESVAFTAHALNNYLSVTRGALELALIRLVEEADPQVRVWLEGAQHATHLMARLVGRLSNPLAPIAPDLRLESFDLLIMVKRAGSFYQPVADRKAIRIAVGSAADVQSVWADRVVTAAVLDNLFSNAIKYSPKSATVRVQVRGEGDWVVCEVRDTGPGLSPEDQGKLFQRGVRLSPKPTADEPSSGYGLAVAREFVEALGGRIWCDSELGKGSCFAFRLPVHRV